MKSLIQTLLHRSSSSFVQNKVTLRKKVTLQTLKSLHSKDIKITMLTAHDYPSGLLCERAEIDMCLVGDSLAMVCLGYENTSQITLKEMMHHSRAVARACKTPFLVGDMPFGSYEQSPDKALDNAVEFIRYGRVESVKMEGGKELVGHVKKLTSFGIPCVGHVGLTPQRQLILGGFKVQGKTLEQAKSIIGDALSLEDAGCQVLVLEAIPAHVAGFITSILKIPTIGIGAGVDCSGQVLVQMDLLGMYDRFLPKFCKVFTDTGGNSLEAIKQYASEVKELKFPLNGTHTYPMKDGQDVAFMKWLDDKLELEEWCKQFCTVKEQ